MNLWFRLLILEFFIVSRNFIGRFMFRDLGSTCFFHVLVLLILDFRVNVSNEVAPFTVFG